MFSLKLSFHADKIARHGQYEARQTMLMKYLRYLFLSDDDTSHHRNAWKRQKKLHDNKFMFLFFGTNSIVFKMK